MKRHALLVGVNSYDDKSIRPLRYSVPDASVLADRFETLGFRSRLLSDPTSAQMKGAVEEMVAGLGPGDVFLFFFSGHGFTAQDGAHLLFCRDDRQKLLRVNGAGTRVDSLEMLAEGPFHRAFLLDSCRSDALAGVFEKGGATTKDLDFVGIAPSTGSTFILRSCNKFLPSLEIERLGHGLFTRGLLDAINCRDAGLARCGDAFAESVRVHMDERAKEVGAGFGQCPCIQLDGPAFSLFGEDFILMPQSQSGGADSPSEPPGPVVAAPVYVTCPVCGRWNKKTDTFKCRECGRDDLCLDHQDEMTFLCRDCVAKKAREAAAQKAEAERRAREEAEREARSWMGDKAGDRKVVRVGSQDIALRWCPPGTFTMGSPTSEEGRYDVETQHRVTLTKGFWLGETEVTKGLWKEVMGDNPSWFESGDDYPVEGVSWDDCQEFLRKLNARFPQSGLRWTLPTEAQWEYACRAGTTGAYGGTGRLDDMGWYSGNSGLDTLPVKRKQPNAWGVYDMHGNVAEWCQDWYGGYPSGTVTNPSGPVSGSSRVLRGGSSIKGARHCRSAFREGKASGGGFGGFRVALVPIQ